MVLTKAVILGGLLVLGARNNRAVRRLRDGRAALQPRLRQFLEVEIGLGLTVLFVAASLTSSPPARDVVADRASVAEVATIFTPQWPRLTSPTHAELAGATTLGDPSSPRTDEDTAWSEYNHHVAGAFVLSIGLLALVASVRRGRWARHWPLLLLGLAAFLFVRDDPEVWPLGPIGFWTSLADVEVLQHRLFVLLVMAFGIFEWMVRTQRLKSPRWAAVFPMLCAVGGALLLTHSHVLSNVKAAYLMEITHTPLALLGLVAGWARWLELRLPDRGEGVPERVWAIALVLVGVLLLMYREG
jgi:putative copper resistance protein D